MELLYTLAMFNLHGAIWAHTYRRSHQSIPRYSNLTLHLPLGDKTCIINRAKCCSETSLIPIYPHTHSHLDINNKSQAATLRRLSGMIVYYCKKIKVIGGAKRWNCIRERTNAPFESVSNVSLLCPWSRMWCLFREQSLRGTLACTLVL